MEFTAEFVGKDGILSDVPVALICYGGLVGMSSFSLCANLFIQRLGSHMFLTEQQLRCSMIGDRLLLEDLALETNWILEYFKNIFQFLYFMF